MSHNGLPPIVVLLLSLLALGVLYGASLIARRVHPHVASIQQATTPEPVATAADDAPPVKANPRADMPGEES